MSHSENRGKRLRARPKRWSNRRIYAFALASICLIILAYVFRPRYEYITVRGGAAIVDSFYSSKPQFMDTTAAFLTFRGITVDLFKDESVTVGLYRRLPAYGYSLIILQVHAGVLVREGPKAPTFLFTNEPYTINKYTWEQLEGQVLSGKIDADNSSEKPLFTIGPLFVAMSIEGNFNNSIVILSTCLGLHTDQLAQAFEQKGAKVFIGWDEKVTLSHANEACTLLLNALIDGRMTVGEAVRRVMIDVGGDSAYKSTLEYSPKEANSLMLKP